MKRTLSTFGKLFVILSTIVLVLICTGLGYLVIGYIAPSVSGIWETYRSKTPTPVVFIPVTPSPFKVVTPVVVSVLPTSTPTNTLAPKPTDTLVSPKPTETPEVIVITPKPMVITTREKVKLRLAYDAFGSYFLAQIVAQWESPIYDLELIPFEFGVDEATTLNQFPEDERINRLSNGEWDVFFSTIDSFGRLALLNGQPVGLIVWSVDKSADADKVVAWPETVASPRKSIARFNDVEKTVIACSKGSVSEYQVLSLLRVVGISPANVTFLYQDSVKDAVNAFLEKRADVVSGWEPDINEAINAGGKALVSTGWWQNIMDVMIISNQADTTKREAVLVFMEDWVKAVNLIKADFAKAAEMIANWTYGEYPTNDWSGVSKENPSEDLQSWLASIAQADLAHNLVIMQNPRILAEQIETAREVWAWGGRVDPNEKVDPYVLIQPWYVLELSKKTELVTARGEFPNNTFSPFAPEPPKMDQQALIDLPTIADLTIRFGPNSSVINVEFMKDIEQYAKGAIQMIRDSDAAVEVVGYSAWPLGYEESSIWEQAEERALNTKLAICRLGGIHPDRVVAGKEIPTDPSHQKIRDENILKTYRKAVIRIKRGGR